MIATAAPIELWGGVECTVNRVGDGYRDQVRLSGHEDRAVDLDLFADLGFKALRYPVLWERSFVGGLGEPDWAWPDTRLARLRDLRIRPVVGLVHHGSGPPHTNLLADDFATGLGSYATAVAERYPWIEDWTPVNEPLTTARFSCLYGHWYPHAADERSLWLALLNQVDATRAAMRAVRRVNPTARLIQTDDLGRTFATQPLASQAEYDNLRRWAGWDLLFGRLDRHHRLFDSIARLGFGDRLRRIADDPCPPDIVGVNHYLTSDRFLDHRTERYPAHLHGGNGGIAYADTEAVRALDPSMPGLGQALREAWQRYRAPVALTEVHNGCTREEQLRWAADAWDTAVALRAEGVDVRAVTAWSLLGSYGWDTLLTADGRYEPGVHDVGDRNAASDRASGAVAGPAARRAASPGRVRARLVAAARAPDLRNAFLPARDNAEGSDGRQTIDPGRNGDAGSSVRPRLRCARHWLYARRARDVRSRTGRRHGGGA